MSLGSELKWQTWYVDSIYGGIVKLDKDVPCRAIFVLPRDNVTLQSGAEPNAKFWPTKSAPQAEVLAHPAVKAGLSHCDFSTSLEFINAGKPVLTFPHHGDQGTNAQNLIDNSAAIGLISCESASSEDDPQNAFYSSQLFNSDHVCR